MKKKLFFQKYEKNTQAFVGIVSDILDSGKNRLKSKDAKRKKDKSVNYKSKKVRKSIARVLTVMHQTQKENLRKYYKSKRLKPTDLRKKKTRAMRRALTPFEKSIKSRKQQRRERLYPMRKFAVKQ